KHGWLQSKSSPDYLRFYPSFSPFISFVPLCSYYHCRLHHLYSASSRNSFGTYLCLPRCPVLHHSSPVIFPRYSPVLPFKLPNSMAQDSSFRKPDVGAAFVQLRSVPHYSYRLPFFYHSYAIEYLE